MIWGDSQVTRGELLLLALCLVILIVIALGGAEGWIP